MAANAGGAWSPIGDVTTTMLWIRHKISTTGKWGRGKWVKRVGVEKHGGFWDEKKSNLPNSEKATVHSFHGICIIIG